LHLGKPRGQAYDPVVEPGPTETALATDFADIARALGSAPTVETTLERIVQAAAEHIDACEHAGIFLLEDDAIRTVAASDSLCLQVDVLQQDTGEGPCLDAVRSKVAYNLSDDLLVDPAYPQFGPQAADLGIRSVLALRLLTDHRLGALNLYAELPRAFGILDRAKAVILASHASTALDAAETRARDADAGDRDLHDALASRGTIGQAQGILMERERITAEQAFNCLRRASQDLNIKLRDIAQGVVDTGEDPRPGAPSPPTPDRT
jgi:hypothetical protein